MAEFRATSLNLVGNYSGPCILLLTGAAVSVKDLDGVNIATWPYNCIRQFRAEEETSVFSFISGRRGPYGVAEYIFELSDHILADLQDALSQFTGAQFHIRPPSTSSSTSQDSRKLSHSSDSEFSVYNSPVHRLQQQSSRSSTSDVFASITEEPHYKAPLHLTPDSSPSRSTKSDRSSPHSRDAWVLNSQSYETTQQALAQKSKSPFKPKPALETPPPPPPKKPGLGMGRLFSSQKQKPAHEGGSPKRSSHFPKQKTLPNIRSHATTDDQSRLPSKQLTVEAFATLRNTARHHPYEDAEVGPKPHRKSDLTMSHPNYDHLPIRDATDMDDALHPVPRRSKSFSPERSSPTPSNEQDRPTSTPTSPDSKGDTSDLDFLPRSSPQVRVRSMNPRLAQHLRKFNGEPLINKSPTVKGRRSPETKRHGHQQQEGQDAENLYNVPRLQTDSQNLYSVPRPQDDEDLYKVPRPQNDEDLYKVPRPQNDEDLYKVPRSQNDEDLYKVPRPQNDEDLYKVPRPQNDEDLYKVPRPQNDEDLYKVPRAQNDEDLYKVPRAQAGSHNDTYSVPRPLPSDMTDGTYRVPRSVLNEDGQDDAYYSLPHGGRNIYNSPQSFGNGSTYHVPRNLSGSELSRVPLPREDNRYEEIEIQPTPKLKASRSFESLFNRRVNPPRRSAFSPEPSSPMKGNYYVDIDVSGQAENEHMYAEIRELPPTLRLGNGLTRAAQQSAQSNYYATVPNDRISPPPVRRPTPELNREGLVKSQELAKQGYELCMPRLSDDKPLTLPPKGATMSMPPRTIPRKNYKSVEKYGIQIPNGICPSERSKPHIEGSSCPPNEGENFMDEYVIITRKMEPSQPQDIPARQMHRSMSTQSTSAAERPGDDYEIMTSAPLNLNRGQAKQNSKSPPQLEISTSINNSEHSYGSMSHSSSSGDFSHTYGNVGCDAAFDMDGMSPPEEPVEALYQTPRPVGSQPLQVPRKQLVRIASGSPRDKTCGNDLRYRSRSVGTMLDVEKHTYVNVSPDEIEAKQRERAASQLPQKKPMPLPRSAPEESLDHKYEQVDISKAKGNAHPLSMMSNGSDTSQ